MGFLNRPMGMIQNLGKKIMHLAEKPLVEISKINEDKEKNEKHIGISGGGTWRQNEGRYRTGYVRKWCAKRKAKRKAAHNSTIVNRGGKKK